MADAQHKFKLNSLALAEEVLAANQAIAGDKRTPTWQEVEFGNELLALEPRIVFDAAVATVVDHVVDQVAAQQAVDALQAPASEPANATLPSPDSLADIGRSDSNFGLDTGNSSPESVAVPSGAPTISIDRKSDLLSPIAVHDDTDSDLASNHSVVVGNGDPSIDGDIDFDAIDITDPSTVRGTVDDVAIIVDLSTNGGANIDGSDIDNQPVAGTHLHITDIGDPSVALSIIRSTPGPDRQILPDGSTGDVPSTQRAGPDDCLVMLPPSDRGPSLAPDSGPSNDSKRDPIVVRVGPAEGWQPTGIDGANVPGTTDQKQLAEDPNLIAIGPREHQRMEMSTACFPPAGVSDGFPQSDIPSAFDELRASFPLPEVRNATAVDWSAIPSIDFNGLMTNELRDGLPRFVDNMDTAVASPVITTAPGATIAQTFEQQLRKFKPAARE